MKYFIGLDVALWSLVLCIIYGDGEIVLEQALDCEVDDIIDCLTQFDQHISLSARRQPQTL